MRTPRKLSQNASGTSREELFDAEEMRRLESLALAARRAHRGRQRAERRSLKKGAGIEFADHRVYVPGDDLRALDLAYYQRTGKLQVRLYEEEEDLSVHLLIDASGSMPMKGRDKLLLGKRLAAALAYIALVRLDRVSLEAFRDGSTTSLKPIRGAKRIFRLLDFLEALDGEGETDLRASARRFIASKPRRGLAVLISDLHDERGFEGAVDILRFARFETLILHIDDIEDYLPRRLGDLTLVDRESGEERQVTITPAVAKRLQAAHAARNAKILRYAREKGVRYARIPVDERYDNATLRLLHEGILNF